MALDDRDWYRDDLRKKTGYVEKADFRVPLSNPNPHYDPKLYRRPPQNTFIEGNSQPSQGWHWSTQLLLWLAICGALYGAFWLLNDYQKAKRQAQAATIAAEHWKQQAEAAQRQLDQIRKNQRFDFFKR